MNNFTGLSATAKGRTNQVNRTYRSMGKKLKREQVITPDCDDLSQLSRKQLESLIHAQRNQLADAQNLIEEMRARTNSDPVIQTKKVVYWDTARVAEESGKSIATICRNARDLGGTKLGSDWVFPVGTRYGGKRKKAK